MGARKFANKMKRHVIGGKPVLPEFFVLPERVRPLFKQSLVSFPELP